MSAGGTKKWMKVNKHRSTEDCLNHLKQQGLQIIATSLCDSTKDYRDIDYTKPTAIMVGEELEGISEQAKQMADENISIPMVGMVQSLNVSVASGVLLAEVQRQRQAAGLYAGPRIDSALYRRLLFEWAHPAVRDFCHERGLRYPALDAEGEILDAPAWYADVRAGNAPLWNGDGDE